MERTKYIVFEDSAIDKFEAIDKCAEKLQEKGITDLGFAKFCKEREQTYPTGLPTIIPIAIPHAKYDNIKCNCICVMKLNNPVEFYRMDDSEEIINVKMIFNLAIKDPDKHLKILQKMMSVLTEEEVINQMIEMDNNELIDFLEKEIG